MKTIGKSRSFDFACLLWRYTDGTNCRRCDVAWRHRNYFASSLTHVWMYLCGVREWEFQFSTVVTVGKYQSRMFWPITNRISKDLSLFVCAYTCNSDTRYTHESVCVFAHDMSSEQISHTHTHKAKRKRTVNMYCVRGSENGYDLWFWSIHFGSRNRYKRIATERQHDSNCHNLTFHL